MKSVRFGLDHGKVVVKEVKKKKQVKPEIHYHITHANQYSIVSDEYVRVPVKKRFDYGICPYCEHKFTLEDQKYCEECGYEL